MGKYGDGNQSKQEMQSWQWLVVILGAEQGWLGETTGKARDHVGKLTIWRILEC